MSILRSRELPRAIMVFSILILLGAYFFDISILQESGSYVRLTGNVIAGMASFVGLINITIVLLRRIQSRREGHWYFAIWGLIVAYVTIIFGIYYGPLSNAYIYFYQNIQAPLYSATTGLLVFFITTATYRSFKVRNVETALLVISGVLVLLGNAPVGEMISPMFPAISNWILDVPNGAASRGMTIGAGIGIIAIGIRNMLGKENVGLGKGTGR